MGRAYDIAGDVDVALEYYFKQANIALDEGVDDKSNEFSANMNIANIYDSRNQYKLAFKHYKLALAASLDDSTNYAAQRLAYGNLGNMCYRFAEYELALEYYKQDLHMTKKYFSEKSPTDTSRAMTNIFIHSDMNVLYCNIGLTQLSLGLPLDSLESHKQDFFVLTGHKISEKNKISPKLMELMKKNRKLCREIVQIFVNIGDVYVEITKFDIALQYYFSALKLAKTYLDETPSMPLYECISKAYTFINGKNQNVRMYGLKALNLAKKFDDQAAVGRISGIIGESYRKNGDFDAAKEYYTASVAKCISTNQYAMAAEFQRQLNDMEESMDIVPATMENIIFEECNTATKLLLFSAETGNLEYIKRVYNNDIIFANYNGDSIMDLGRIKDPNMSIVLSRTSKMIPNILQFDHSGSTVMHIAAMYGHEDIIRYMLECHKADPFAENNSFETPMQLAIVYGHHHIVNLIITDYGGMRFNYTPRMLLERRRREDSLFECRYVYTLMFPRAKNICFYVLHSILFLVISLILGWIVPVVYMASLLNHKHLSTAFAHSYKHIVLSRHFAYALGICFVVAAGPGTTLYIVGLPYSTLVMIGTLMLAQIALTRLVYLKSKSDVTLRVIKHPKQVKCSLVSISQACTVLSLLAKLAVCIASVTKTVPHDRELRLYPLSAPLGPRSSTENQSFVSNSSISYAGRKHMSNVVPYQLKLVLEPILSIDGLWLTSSLNLMAVLFLVWYIITSFIFYGIASLNVYELKFYYGHIVKHSHTVFNTLVRTIIIVLEMLFLPMYEYLLMHLLCFGDNFRTVHRNMACFSQQHKLLMLCSIWLVYSFTITMYFIAASRFMEPQSHMPHIRTVPAYKIVTLAHNLCVGFFTVFFSSDSIIRVVGILLCTCITIYEIHQLQPCRNMPIMNQWHKSMYATIGVLAVYVFIDAKFQLLSSNLMKYSWLFACALFCIPPAWHKIRFRPPAMQYLKSRFDDPDKSPYKVGWENNSEKYKVVPSRINTSVVDIPSEVVKPMYMYHSVNGLRRRIAPREEGNIYDEKWKPRIKNVEMKERDDNNFNFNRSDLGNSKREAV